jgi:hypothetical protein
MLKPILILALSLTSLAASAASTGSYEPVIQLRDRSGHFAGTPERPMPEGGWWVTPIHATLLGDGKALLTGWGRFDFHDCRIHRTRQNGTSWLIDPASLTGGAPRTLYVEPLDEQAREHHLDVLYCAGNVTLADGRVLLVGGARYLDLGDGPEEQEFGLNYFRLFDPATHRFERVDFAPQGSPRKQPGMDWYEDGMMWYPTETRLPGGRVLVTGGFDRNCSDASCMNRDIELFDPTELLFGRTPWSTWVSHEQAPEPVYDPGIKDYTHTFLLYRPAPASLGGGAERDLVLMGWPGRVAELSLDPALPAAERIYVPQDGAGRAFGRPGGAAAWDASAALVGPGEILVVGGGAGARAEAQRIDLYDPMTGKWRSRDTGITRHNPATTLLPDGTVLIVNGEPGDDRAGAIGDRHQAQIYDPYTDRLTTLPAWPDANPADRGYHSFSLLLKDGRILLGGGMVTLAQVGCERPDLRIFNPPYLTAGPRPVVDPATEGREIRVGDSFELAYSGAEPRAERGVALMALGSETHSFDHNQRYVPLSFRKTAEGRLTVTAPANTHIAPEGLYLLFMIGESGAPSEGRLVKLVN